MDPRINTDPHILIANQSTSSPALSPSPVITPTKSQSRGPLASLAGWQSYSDMRAQAPGGNDSAVHPESATSSALAPAPGAYQTSSHLPTPQSPGNMSSYLLTRTPTTSQDTLQPDQDMHALPTEFRSHPSHSPLPSQSHSIPTPDPSPLIARSRTSGPYLLSQPRINNLDDNDIPTPSNRGGLRSGASTPPRTPSRQPSTRAVTPVLQSRPTTPLERRPTERPRSAPNSTHPNTLNANDSASGRTSYKVEDESRTDVTTQTTESRRPDYFKRMRRLAPPSSTGTGGTSLAADLGSGDGSLLWSSVNMGVIDSPIRGKRIALFQETSEESFEESLMAGGYGRYRSDRPWKRDGDVELLNRASDAIGEGDLGSEEEKRKKTRLAAFLNPPRVSSSVTPLFPVEIEGCGRVLMKVESSEPQTPPKPASKAKRTRKRKKALAEVECDVEMGNTAPESRAVDGPNWPDAEFPWRSRLATSDGLSNTEREERLRYIESFLDRESDDDVEEGHSSVGRRSPDEISSRSPRSGKLFSRTRDRRGSSALSIISSDPADAKSALLSKKSIQAVQLRLLRSRNADTGVDGDDDEPLCICQGPDDGRPLVQCDACRTWYHLECIGIQSTSELGKEEDPWFCANCVEVKTPPPVIAPLSEPTFVTTSDGERDVVHDLFLNAGLNPSPATPWTRTMRAPRTPPRMQHAPPGASGSSSWDEPPSSSSRGDPRTPQFNTTSAFGDMVRVYGMTPGRSLEPSMTASDESPFDPTSTPSRGIMFGLPFATPKEGRWGLGSLHAARGGGHDLFHTPKHAGEGTASTRFRNYHGRVGEVSDEGASGAQAGVFRPPGVNDMTALEREAQGGPKRLHVLDSPLGAKRSKRTFDS